MKLLGETAVAAAPRMEIDSGCASAPTAQRLRLQPRIILLTCSPAAAKGELSNEACSWSGLSLHCPRRPCPADLSGPPLSPSVGAHAGCDRPLRRRRGRLRIAQAPRLHLNAALLLALLLLLQPLAQPLALAAVALSAPPSPPPAAVTLPAATVGSWPPQLPTFDDVPTAAAPGGQWPADLQPEALNDWLRLLQRLNDSGAVTPPLPHLPPLRQLESLLALRPWPLNSSQPPDDAVTAAVAGSSAMVAPPFSADTGGSLLLQSAAGSGRLRQTGLPPVQTLLTNPALLFHSDSTSATDFTAASGGALGSGGVAVRTGIDWAALGIGSEQYEAAALAVRLSILLQLATYINFAGRQGFVAQYLISLAALEEDPPVAARVVRGVGEQLVAVSRIYQG